MLLGPRCLGEPGLFLISLAVKRLSWRSILQRVEGRRIVGLWYGVEDGYLRLELHDGSVLLVAASWEGCHIMIDGSLQGLRLEVSNPEDVPRLTEAAEPL